MSKSFEEMRKKIETLKKLADNEKKDPSGNFLKQQAHKKELKKSKKTEETLKSAEKSVKKTKAQKVSHEEKVESPSRLGTMREVEEIETSLYFDELYKSCFRIVSTENLETSKKLESLKELLSQVDKGRLTNEELVKIENYIKKEITELESQSQEISKTNAVKSVSKDKKLENFKRRAEIRYKQIAAREPEFYAINKERLYDVKMPDGKTKKCMVTQKDFDFLIKYQNALKDEKNEALRSSVEKKDKLSSVILGAEQLELPDGIHITFDDEFNVYICGVLLGEGGYGEVFIGQTISTGEICAIKLQNLKQFELKNSEAETRYHKEHQNLRGTRLYKDNKKPTYTLITMQKFEIGESHDKEKEKDDNELEVFTYEEFETYNAELLNDARNTLFDGADYLRLRLKSFISLTKALQAIHKEGNVHRDLKEANVLIDETGNARIVDFGTVVKKGESVEVVGTLYYMPDSLQDKYDSQEPHAYTGKEDIYALGIMLGDLYNSSFKKYEYILPDSIKLEFENLIENMLSFDDNPEAVPSLDEVLNFLKKVDNYILLTKPLDLSLAKPEEVTHYVEAHDRLVGTYPELDPLRVNISGGKIFTNKRARELCHKWSNEPLNASEEAQYSAYLQIIADLSNRNKAYIKKYDEHKKEKVKPKPFLGSYTLFANTDSKYNNAKDLQHALEDLYDWKKKPRTPHELKIYIEKVEKLIKAAKENDAKALGLLSSKFRKGDVAKMLEEAEKKLRPNKPS